MRWLFVCTSEDQAELCRRLNKAGDIEFVSPGKCPALPPFDVIVIPPLSAVGSVTRLDMIDRWLTEWLPTRLNPITGYVLRL